MKRRFDLSKCLFYATLALVVAGAAFGFGLYHGAKRTELMWFVMGLRTSVADAVETVVSDAPTLAGMRPEQFLHPVRYQGSGVTVNAFGEDDGSLVLLASYFGERTSELRLIRRDGRVVARWPLRYSEVFSNSDHLAVPPATDWNVDVMGLLALSDGSVVFNFHQAGLVKLDRCGGVVWKVAISTHHSVVQAEDGGFWVPGNAFLKTGAPSPLPNFVAPLSIATLLKVSDDGVVEAEISAPQIFYDNDIDGLLTVGREFSDRRRLVNREIIHLNKITELKSDIAADFPMFEAGDLMLSIRDHNLVMVVDPRTRKVKWWRVGPWLRQHDPEFKPGGTIVVFNNNQYLSIEDPNVDSFHRSNIIEIDPATGRHWINYGEREGEVLSSSHRSSIQLMPQGGMFIVEYPHGRVFETDREGRVVWEYVNRYGGDKVAAITDGAVYPPGYFRVRDWSCATARN